MLPKPKHFINKVTQVERLLKTISILRIIFGSYSNVSKSKPICNLLKSYCVFVNFIIVASYWCNSANPFSIYLLNIIQYTYIHFVYLKYGDVCFFEFISAIKIIDRIIGFKKLSSVTQFMWLIITINALMRTSVSLIHLLFKLKRIMTFFAVLFSLVSLDLNFFINLLVFSLLHNRMKKLRVFLESNSVTINITGRNEVETCVKNIRKCLKYYNNLLNTFDNMDKQLQHLVATTWFIESLSLTMSAYGVVKNHLLKAPKVFVASIFMEMSISFMKMTIEACIVAATIQEVDKIKKLLTTQLLRTSDESIRFELTTMLQYVKLRPFQYNICHVVPLNIYLPFTVISLCITYVIVALQLTHFNENTIYAFSNFTTK